MNYKAPATQSVTTAAMITLVQFCLMPNEHAIPSRPGLSPLASADGALDPGHLPASSPGSNIFSTDMPKNRAIAIASGRDGA